MTELSGCGNPGKFARLAERVARAKPVLALTTGDAIQDALLARAGVEIAPSLDALLGRLA